MIAFRLFVVAVVCLLPLLTQGQNLQMQTCSRDNTATIQPDAGAWLGGIVSLNNAGSGGFGCGDPSGSMQAYEAFRWVLDLLNKKDEFLQTQYLTDYYVPGIRLGMKVKNYCRNTLSAEAAIAEIYPELGSDDEGCITQNNNLTIGIIGGSISDDAMGLSDALVNLDIPLVSYEATAPMLTMPGMYTNFMRTIPPDGPLMEVIAQVFNKMGWKFVVIVYDQGSYGRAAYNELHARLVASDICVTAGVSIDDADPSTAANTLGRVMATDTVGVIYFGGSEYARALIEAGNMMLPESGDLQWIFVDIPLDMGFGADTVYHHGVISITAASRFIVEFEDHWIRIDENNPSPENPWFTQWFEYRYDCSFSSPGPGQRNCAAVFPGATDNERERVKRQQYQQDQYVESAVMAVYAYANALRLAQMTRCPGVSGVCPALRDMTKEEFYNDYLKRVDLTFSADERVPSLASQNVQPYNAPKHLSFTSNGDITDPSYYIWNYNDIETGSGADVFRFRRVGSYISGNLDLNLDNVGLYDETRLMRLNPLPASPCPDRGCSPCLGLPADVNYYFEPGDVVIEGIFSLHAMGVTPLTCGGPLSTNQFMFLEAMIYAVRQANQDPTILNPLRLGGLGMDDCSSSTLGQALLAQVQRGNLVIQDRTGSELDPRTIEAYTAAHTAPLTLPLAEAMNMLMRPMVGYRASSARLDDHSMYPYYLRAMPGIHDEIRAIILLLKRLEWMYVQVITSDSAYSKDAEMVFRELAAKAGICVVATHPLGHTDDDVMHAVMGLGVNSATTPPTVALLDMHSYRRLLHGLSMNLDVRRDLVLIGTSMWGTDPRIVRGYEIVANDAITLSPRRSTLASFEAYLRGLDVNTYMLNPWFADWYMAAHNCSMSGQAGMVMCDTSRPITDGVNFMLMYEVEDVINAVRAISEGLHNTLRHYCGDNYQTVCTAFVNAQEKGARFLDEIRAVTFTIDDTNPAMTFRFQDNSGVIPFEINRYLATSNTYSKVGDVNPWAGTLSFISTPEAAVPMSTFHPSCRSPCLQCLYMFDQLDYWYIPGDLVIAAIFDIHQRGDGPYNCGPIKTINGGLYTEVFNFALQKINRGDASVRMNGITLGGLIFDGCSNPPRSTAIINRVHTGMDIRDPVTGSRFYPVQIVNWMTYDSQVTIESANLLQKIGIPIISPGATSSVLNDKSKFQTFFRTIPSDSVIVRGMAELANNMGWRYVIVLNAPDEANRENRDRFREYLQSFGICVVASYEFETDGSPDVIMRSVIQGDTDVVAVFAEPDRHIADVLEATSNLGSNRLRFIASRPWGVAARDYPTLVADSFFFSLRSPNIGEFATYLSARAPTTMDNPWFQEIYEEIFQCNLPGTFRYPTACSNSPITSSPNWEQDIWTLSTLNAIYATTEMIHRTTARLCGPNYSGSCDRAMYGTDTYELSMQDLDAENFTDITGMMFEFIEREANRQYSLLRYTSTGSSQAEGSLDRVGSLTLNNRPTLLTIYNQVQSECRGDCVECRTSDANLQDFTMIQGDVYIVGLFDVHKSGGSPFTCGDVNDKHGLPLLEAFNYAIEYVNRKEGIFRNRLSGVQLGGIGLDMCQSPTRAANLVSNIHSGNTVLSKDGITVDPRRIDAYVATMDTESSIRVADILNEISMPQISYGATGIELLDREKYSFFLRSVPADDKQSRAIVSYLKKFQFNNIQVVASFDEIGEPGREEFKKLALANQICIKTEYIAGEDGMADMETDVENIVRQISQQPEAQVVILWMKNPLPLLEAANRNINVVRNVLFIATDKWGADPVYLENNNIRTLLEQRNLVILDVETADIPGYDLYLEDKTPDNYLRNPWFQDYFEMFQDCYWDAPSGTRTTECDRSSTIPRADHYVQDPYVLYVINAVFSAAMGINNAIGMLCSNSPGVQGTQAGLGFFGICGQYAASGERRQRVMDGLKMVNFVDDTHQPFFFTEDGQSDRGFHIYNITGNVPGTGGNPASFRYENVGSYNDTHFLKLDITYESEKVARCDADGSDPNLADCTCPFPPDINSRYMKKEEDGPGLTLVYIGDVHQPHPTNPLACGPINTGVDLQKLLAFFYAIETSNRNNDRTVKLDGLALDSCSHSTRLGQDVYNVLSGNPLCDSAGNGQLVNPASIAAFVIDQDRNVLPVADILGRRGITTVSPTAGHPMLMDRYAYPYFLSTRSSYEQTANAIFSVADRAQWDFLSVIYTDTISHRGAKDALLSNSRVNGMCVGTAAALPPDADLEVAESVLETISRQVGARAVVLFVEPEHFRLLMRASESLSLTGRFIWVVTSDWAHSGQNIAGYEQEVAGSIMIQVRSAILHDFTEWMKSLTFTNRRGIPDDWFVDIYQTIHQCNILDLQNPSSESIQFSRVCTEDERITDEMVSQDPAVLHVIISVYAIADGLSKVEGCSGVNLDISACLQTLESRDNRIYEAIQNAEFAVLPDLLGNNTFQFSFNNDGTGAAGFVINNYRASGSVSTNPYVAYPLGSFTPANGISLDFSQYAGGNLYSRGNVPRSECASGTTCTCRLPMGQTWDFTPTSILDPSNVRVGGVYSHPETGEMVYVNKIPEAGDRFEDTWAIILTVLACVGVLVSGCLFVYLLVMYPVRGGTSILGFILSFGIILLYLMVFPFIAHADEQICGLRRFGLGFVYSICYSALMVKLVDCWRVRGKNEAYDVKYSKLGRPSGLFLITLFFVLVQVMINAEWLILREPKMVRIFYRNEYWPRCAPDNFYDEGLVLSLTYIMVIIAVSLILAFLTFTTTKNHRESRWICGILVLSIPIWVIWCTVSILGAVRIRDGAVAVGLLVTATVMLVLFPIRKLYLLHKYNTLIEEQEEKEEAMANGKPDYSSVYGRQYDNNPRLHDSGSTHGGSTRDYNTPRSGDSSVAY